MTVQTKRFIEIDDIVGLRFECRCGSEVVTRISRYKTMPLACSNCGEQFADYHSEEVQRIFDEILTQFRKVKRVTEQRKFKFAFEITPDITQLASQKAALTRPSGFSLELGDVKVDTKTDE